MPAKIHDRREGERRLRKELAEIERDLDDHFAFNLRALAHAQAQGIELIMAAVNRGELTPEVSEGLKQKVQEWWV